MEKPIFRLIVEVTEHPLMKHTEQLQPTQITQIIKSKLLISPDFKF